MPWRAMKCLAKSLEPSSCAAACVGPKMRSPRRGTRRPRRRPAAPPARPPWRGCRRPCANFNHSGMESRSHVVEPRPRGRCRRCRAPRRRARPSATARAARPARARGRREPMTRIFIVLPGFPHSRDDDAQCRKCRMPVNTIAMPCSSAAAMTSSSRIAAAGLDHRGRAGLARPRRGRRGTGRTRRRPPPSPRSVEARVLRLDRGDARASRRGSSGRRRRRASCRPCRRRWRWT